MIPNNKAFWLMMSFLATVASIGTPVSAVLLDLQKASNKEFISDLGRELDANKKVDVILQDGAKKTFTKTSTSSEGLTDYWNGEDSSDGSAFTLVRENTKGALKGSIKNMEKGEAISFLSDSNGSTMAFVEVMRKETTKGGKELQGPSEAVGGDPYSHATLAGKYIPSLASMYRRLDLEAQEVPPSPAILKLTEIRFPDHEGFKRQIIQGNSTEDQGKGAVRWKNQNGFYYLEVMPKYSVGKDCPTKRENIYGKFSPIVDFNPPGVSQCNMYDFQIVIYNDLTDGATLHWHGLTPPSNQDGVPYVANPNVHPKNLQSYRFNQFDYPGSYWMHSHTGFQQSYGVAAPLILQHDDSYFEDHGFDQEDDLVIMLENSWLDPICTFAADTWYKKECKNSKENILKAFFTINGQEGVLKHKPSKNAKKIRLRFINGGSNAPWNVTNAFATQYKGKSVMMEFLATDGHDVDTNNAVFSNDFFLGLANRIDVLVDIGDGTKDILITCVQMLWLGPVNDPALRHIIIRGQHTPHGERIDASTLPNYYDGGRSELMPNFDIMANLTAAHPIADMPITKNFTIQILGGSFTGGFPLTIFDGLKLPGQRATPLYKVENFTDLGNMKFQLPPYKVYRNKKNNAVIRSIADCETGTNNQKKKGWGVMKKGIPFADVKYEPSSYTGTDSCLWEWCDVPNEDCKHFDPEPEDVQHYTPNDHFVPVCYGDRVRILFINYGAFTPDQGHPLHLHGHEFVLRELYNVTDDGELHLMKNYTITGPKVDTIWVPYKTAVAFDFDANNPGEHLFHCHIDQHLEKGMLTTIRYMHDDKCKDLPDFVGGESKYPEQICKWTSCHPNTEKCMDSNLELKLRKNKKDRSCSSFSAESKSCTNSKAVRSHCPVSCNACEEYACADSVANFKRGKKYVTCSDLKKRHCANDDVKSSCRALCGHCHR